MQRGRERCHSGRSPGIVCCLHRQVPVPAASLAKPSGSKRTSGSSVPRGPVSLVSLLSGPNDRNRSVQDVPPPVPGRGVFQGQRNMRCSKRGGLHHWKDFQK